VRCRPDETTLLYPRGGEISSTPLARLRLNLLTSKLLSAWVLSRHAGILAAFRASSLCPSGPRSKESSEPFDESLRLKTRAETMEALSPAQLRVWRAQLTPHAALRGRFHSGPEPLRDSGFVALSQTIPCLLGNAWFALIQRPQTWRLLHQHRWFTEQAIQELLCYAGLVRTLYRTATADTDLNGYFIHKGERVILRIIAANHDPDRFSCRISWMSHAAMGAILPWEPGRTRV
jgi:Cytochrome P450